MARDPRITTNSDREPKRSGADNRDDTRETADTCNHKRPERLTDIWIQKQVDAIHRRNTGDRVDDNRCNDSEHPVDKIRCGECYDQGTNLADHERDPRDRVVRRPAHVHVAADDFAAVRFDDRNWRIVCFGDEYHNQITMTI